MRIRFNTSGVTELVLNWQFLTKIWKPDTTFLNGQKCYLHKITVPNRFIRISPHGRISYSQRLTIWARCPMYIGKFPFDFQSCPLSIGSYSYTGKDVMYAWDSKPLSIDSRELAQYDIIDWQYGVRNTLTNRKLSSGFRNDSVAFLNFDLERQPGFFLLGIYFPLTLNVVCSWVSFWIVKTDVPSRVALGVMTILSVVKIGFGGKAKPQVGYATALDVYILICFFFTFAALTEFAIMNFITIYFKRLRQWEEDKPEKAKARLEKLEKNKRKELESNTEEELNTKQEINPPKENIDREVPKDRKLMSNNPFEVEVDDEVDIDALEDLDDIKKAPIDEAEYSEDDLTEEMNEADIKEEIQTENRFVVNIFRKIEIPNPKTSTKLQTSWDIIVSYYRDKYVYIYPVDGDLLYDETQYVVDRIDEIARIGFPLAFIATCFTYYIVYIYL